MSFEITKHVKYRFFEYTHSGTVHRDDIAQAWRELLLDPDFTENEFNLLTDYRGGEFMFSVKHTDVIDEFLHSIRHILKDKKQAVIADKPFPTALSLLFAGKLYDKIGFRVEVFSTRQAAEHWLLNQG